MKLVRSGVGMNLLRTSARYCSAFARRKSSERARSLQETRYRRFREELKEFVDRLSAKEAVVPAVTRGQIVQVLAVIAILLHQHHVNKRGRCKFCVRSGWKWKFWSRRPLCTVYRTASFVMSRELDEVWWQLFDSVGKEWNLVEVREWMKSRALDTTCVVCGGASVDGWSGA
jgi:hypothetical protein